jgi:hypothetical protein
MKGVLMKILKYSRILHSDILAAGAVEVADFVRPVNGERNFPPRKRS